MKIQFGKRLLALALVGAMTIGALTSCNSNDNKDNDKDTAPVTQQGSNNNKPEKKIVTEIVLVKSSLSSKVVSQICTGMKDYIKENTDVEISIVNDYTYTYEQKEGRVHFFVGDPDDQPLTETAMEKAADGTAVILTEDDQVAFYSENDAALWVAVSHFLGDCVYDNAITIESTYADYTYDFNDNMRQNWKQPIPAYFGGELDGKLYSAGVGANLNESTLVSDMSLVRNTTLDEFFQYVTRLDLLGYKLLYSNKVDDNYYYGFTDPLGIFIHTYYTDYEKIVRTVVDRNSTPLDEFCYTTEPSENSTFYMFNHNTEGENTFLIHCADNSWIFIDGGVATLDDKYAQGIFKFMSEKSNLQEGEKLVISAWYLTHAHRDHFQAFYSLINQYHDKIDLQRMIANLPDANQVTHNSNWKDFVPCMSLINKYYPDMMYMKAHTGMNIQIADVSFQILCSQEDLLDYWILNKTEWANVWSKWTTTEGKSDPNYQFNRNADKKYDINNSSLVSLITVGNGMTVLELGDMYRANDWMFPKYSMSSVTANLLIFAHHLNNDELINTYVEYIKQAGQLYGLCASVEQSFSNSHSKIPTAFTASKNQYLVLAKYDTIYGFTLENGTLTKNSYAAYYSRQGKLDRLT